MQPTNLQSSSRTAAHRWVASLLLLPTTAWGQDTGDQTQQHDHRPCLKQQIHNLSSRTTAETGDAELSKSVGSSWVTQCHVTRAWEQGLVAQTGILSWTLHIVAELLLCNNVRNDRHTHATERDPVVALVRLSRCRVMRLVPLSLYSSNQLLS
jgi:hypothetical protein